MRRAVLCDSSAILALLDADDRDHAAAVRIARRLADERRALVVTNYLEVETHALLLAKLGRSVARDWLTQGGLPIVRVSAEEERQAREIALGSFFSGSPEGGTEPYPDVTPAWFGLPDRTPRPDRDGPHGSPRTSALADPARRSPHAARPSRPRS